MNRTLLCLVASLLALRPGSAHAQDDDANGRFGVALNASLNSELQPIRLVPTVTYLTGKSQFEAGFGFHPFVRANQRTLSAELSHKVFPNGIDKTLNLYLISRLTYGNQRRNAFFRTTLHYVFLNAGYGLELNGRGGSYIGTNVTFGVFGLGRRSDNPSAGYASSGLFDQGGFNVAFQLQAGYRF
ncbi:MAG: hypothetical protein AAF211_05435 [Myxococcota bacterium]